MCVFVCLCVSLCVFVCACFRKCIYFVPGNEAGVDGNNVKIVVPVGPEGEFYGYIESENAHEERSSEHASDGDDAEKGDQGGDTNKGGDVKRVPIGGSDEVAYRLERT